MLATYRETPTSPPIACEVIGVRRDGFVCKEVGRYWPGVWIAQRGTLRRVTGLSGGKPVEVKDPVADRLLAKLNRAGVK
jgi:hypothetical protein